MKEPKGREATARQTKPDSKKKPKQGPPPGGRRDEGGSGKPSQAVQKFRKAAGYEDS